MSSSTHRLLPSPQLKKVIEHLENLSKISQDSGPILSIKRMLLDMYFYADPSITPSPSLIQPALIPSDNHVIGAEWVLADNVNTQHRILYIHGGSWIAGSPASHRTLASRLSHKTGCAVLSVAYRLAPENLFPDGLNDCIEAYSWLRKYSPDGKSSAKSTFIAGDSAGANLCLSSTLKLKNQNAELPNAVVVFSPPTNLNFQTPSIKENENIDPIIHAKSLPLIKQIYLKPEDSLDNPYVSPIYGDLHDFPPLLIQVGSREVLLDDSVLFHEAALKAGVDSTLQIFEGMPHVFQGFAPFLTEAEEALTVVGKFITKHMAMINQ